VIEKAIRRPLVSLLEIPSPFLFHFNTEEENLLPQRDPQLREFLSREFLHIIPTVIVSGIRFFPSLLLVIQSPTSSVAYLLQGINLKNIANPIQETRPLLLVRDVPNDLLCKRENAFLTDEHYADRSKYTDWLLILIIRVFYKDEIRVVRQEGALIYCLGQELSLLFQFDQIREMYESRALISCLDRKSTFDASIQDLTGSIQHFYDACWGKAQAMKIIVEGGICFQWSRNREWSILLFLHLFFLS
jgi:hypothetical protein